MKKILNSFIIAFSFIFSYTTQAQISGNQVYGNNSYSSNSKAKSLKSVITTDSTLVITSRILMNKEADFYLLTLGVGQEGKSVKEGIKLINERINSFTKSLRPVGINTQDYYVDFISQTKIYDYNIEENKAQQYEDGFEIKKNIILKFNNLSDFEKIIELASEQDIYDIIKVDYRNDAVNDNIYEEMLKASLAIIEKKKDLYQSANSARTIKSHRIISDNLYSIYPNSQYKQYQAYESSNLNIYSKNSSDNYIKKEQRKSKTYFYEGMDASGFDKIINTESPVVGIQYILELVMAYEFIE